MLRVTADTNILISGIIFPRGKPFQLLELAREGKINLTISEAILGEMSDVLARKFAWPPEHIVEARRRLQAMARTVTTALHWTWLRKTLPIIEFWNALFPAERITSSLATSTCYG